jgi:DNA (cytosine-5)-methyltransferase 1
MLKIGTDCSGIEAPIEALKQLKVPFKHVFSSEIDPYARQSILANYHPEILYEDLTQRNHSQLPDLDIYVCGFPCQPFSLMGRKGGSTDTRANIMLHCIEVIQKKKPKIFILENVKNFKFIESGEPFRYLIDQLTKNNKYSVYHDIYNTKDYAIPQNRERIYIIGIRKDIQKKEFVKPKPMKMKSLDSFIIDKTVYSSDSMPYTIKKKIIGKVENSIIPCDGYSPPMKNMCRTLTYSNCKYMFHTSYNRYLNWKECLLLQGFRKSFKKVVTDLQLHHQIGNSMSVNVLKVIFKEIFKCI